MPIYEYECANSHRFDLRQSFSDKPTADCPTCNNIANRVFRAVPVHFKGSGFYVNDYGRGSAGATGSSKGDDSKESESGSNKETASTPTSKETSTATAGSTGDSGDK
ncbi:hypothetical protein M1O29_00820 [Dehalococcoidia bacterium]|nr:hypothetical protein [Dehalococcoidia bacterium]